MLLLSQSRRIRAVTATFANLTLILALGLAVLAHPPAARADTVPQFEPINCDFEIPDGFRQDQNLRCGYVSVPENRAKADSKSIKIAVAVFKQPGGPSQDATIFLQGGPGGAAIADFAAYLTPFFIPASGRDLIFVDQRGTGMSQPSLMCQEISDLSYELLNQKISVEETIDRQVKAALACRDRLIGEGIDLSGYTNKANAADIEAVRLALGYEKLNLYGISYGTRLALTVMRDFPASVRSAVIDGLDPLQSDYFSDPLITTRRAFDQIFQGCALDPDCNQAYPNLEKDTYALIESLNREPRPIRAVHPYTGKEYDALIDGTAFTNVIFTALYISELIPNLPGMIATTIRGDNALLESIASYTLFAFEDIAWGMYYSLTCESEYPFSTPDRARVAALALPPVIRQAQLASILGAFQTCAGWGMPSAAPVEDQAVRSDIPTLVTSGEYDPITPSVFGDITASTLKNAYNFTFPGLGHGATMSECPRRLVIRFILNPAQKPNDVCLAQMSGPRFLIY